MVILWYPCHIPNVPFGRGYFWIRLVQRLEASLSKFLALFFSWAIKTFQYFFPPHKAIQARYVVLFAIALALLLYSGVTTYYIWARVWNNPQFNNTQFATVNTQIPPVADAPRVTEDHLPKFLSGHHMVGVVGEVHAAHAHAGK